MKNVVDIARDRVGREMDWWRLYLLDRVKAQYDRDSLTSEEVITCAILTVASLAEQTELK